MSKDEEHPCSGDGCLTCRDLENQKQGRSEVVEWIRSVNHSGDFYYSFDQAELEAKVREWGL